MSDYKHPKWQKKRLEILERDDFRCVECGSKDDTLHVHHRFYIKGRNIWDYPETSLTTLCEDCHNYTHYKYTDDSWVEEGNKIECMPKYSMLSCNVDYSKIPEALQIYRVCNSPEDAINLSDILWDISTDLAINNVDILKFFTNIRENM